MAESGGVRRVGGGEGLSSLGLDLGDSAVVNRRRRVQCDAGVAVNMVVVI